MSIPKQLYQLQETELEIEAKESVLKQSLVQLKDNRSVVEVQSRLTQEQQSLDELKQQQHSAEWEVDDLTGKVATAEEELYSGRIKNPKELASLQHEVELFKEKRGTVEEKALDIMDQVELAESNVKAISGELQTVETEWQRRQQELSAEVEQLKTTLSDLKQRRQQYLDRIDPQAVELYNRLIEQKGQAVARVEQGVCSGCRISLPIAEVQRARSGNLTQCSSCGRILFLA